MAGIGPEEFAGLMARLGPYEPQPRLAVAVSGGADSLALCLLAHDWAAGQGGAAIAVTVDHGLRPEAAAEAVQAGRWLAAKGISHHIVRWTGPKPRADIQAAARAARHRLLQDWCGSHGVLHLLLAHHLDDQAETLIQRLGRGSGVDGLSAMSAIVETASCRLLRPLLGIPGQRLRDMLRDRGQDWIEDPSNRDPAYQRVRLRARLPDWASEGLTPRRLGDTARRLGRARIALEQAVADLAVRAVLLHPLGFARCDAALLAAAPEDVGLRLLARLLLCIGGGGYVPRLERLERLYDEIRGGLSGGRTLGGCLVLPKSGGQVAICREAARIEAVPARPGLVTWDGRFQLIVGETPPSAARIAALGEQGWALLPAADPARSMSQDIPWQAKLSLPALWDEEGVCEAPALGYNRLASVGKPPCIRKYCFVPANPLTAMGHCLV